MVYINTIVNKDGISQAEFIKKLANSNLRLEGVEIRRELLPEKKESRLEFFSEVLETGKHKKWNIYYSVPEPLFCPTGINPDFEDYLEEAEAMTAISLKINIGNLAGIRRADRNAFNQLIQSRKIQITIENSQTELNGKAQAVIQALHEINEMNFNIGLTFDSGNWLVMDENPEELFEDLKSFISVLHLKNMNTKNETVLLKDINGQLDWRQFLNTKTPIILEYPMSFEDIAAEVQLVNDALESR
ncbi:MAG: hypothetical protein LBV19_04690 [Streptococcaceae bacterium]|jgi:hypothetical protein|nr:hypothetical protein [Streptococcaceae bacterium]